MSRIYFHNINTPAAEVWGGERHLLGNYCSKALLYALGGIETFGKEESWIMKHIPPSCYLHQSRRAGYLHTQDIETWLNVGSMTGGIAAGLLFEGELIPLFDLQLNSALAMGGDALKLAARIHWQCEIHCFVEGANREWLADMIEDARALAIFRADVGWESVCELLRSAKDSPVVCSYSVCEQFPGYHIADWPFKVVVEGGREYREYDESWYDLTGEKQWELSMAALRKKNETSRLELRPEDWNDFHVGARPISGFDFANSEFKAGRVATAARAGAPVAAVEGARAGEQSSSGAQEPNDQALRPLGGSV